jgi:DNA-binding MarR family transcriptional regulator
VGRVTEPDLAIIITAANRCLADRLADAVATAGGDQMRPSFGFVLRAVAAEQPTVSRLAELLAITKQGASQLADDMVSLGYLERTSDPADRRRTHLSLSPTGQRIRARALAESHAIEDELRQRFGDTQVAHLRALLTDFIQRHGGAEEIAAQRSRAPDEPSPRRRDSPRTRTTSRTRTSASQTASSETEPRQ